MLPGVICKVAWALAPLAEQSSSATAAASQLTDSKIFFRMSLTGHLRQFSARVEPG
jgi:hypothetical protein